MVEHENLQESVSKGHVPIYGGGDPGVVGVEIKIEYLNVISNKENYILEWKQNLSTEVGKEEELEMHTEFDKVPLLSSPLLNAMNT